MSLDNDKNIDEPKKPEKNDKQQLEKQQEQNVEAPQTWQSYFHHCTDHEVRNFSNFENFSNWLHRPVDGAALGVFRMLYGAAMLIDLVEERGGSQMDVRFGESQHCHFPLFQFIRAADYSIMGCIYLCMLLGALGIMFGYLFRISCLAYIVPYWYIFLLDKPAWNNHSYLFGLVGSMFFFTQANNYCSMDKYLNPNLPKTVPYWNYFIIKFQFFVLYMYAGLKKLTAEWLSGYAMSSLSRHWVFTPFHYILSSDMTDLLIVHWFTAIFDFTIPFLMTFKRTRQLATPFMISFHLMNTRLFYIGMFPWVCLAEVPLFYSCDWPRKVIRCPVKNLLTTTCNKIRNNDSATKQRKNSENSISSTQDIKMATSKGKAKKKLTNKSEKLITCIILGYCALQLFLPYSHFITQGYNNWTDGLYGYSWDMMVHTYDTILISIKIVDNKNNEVHYLDPFAFTEFDRWTKYADMAWQYAHCIKHNIDNEFNKMNMRENISPLSSTNISIYFDIWCSMNGRFQQRVFDPRVDLLRAEWSPFKRTNWSLPVLNELNYMRPRLRSITNDVLNWNNYSDVVFVADFPGLTLDNYISTELTNVTLTILEGKVRYKSDNESDAYYLTAGKSLSLPTGITHHVTTIGHKPSCYLYTYVNQTMLNTEMIIIDEGELKEAVLPLWKEFLQRLQNFKRFFMHIVNCLLYLIYKIPIPVNIRERN